MVIGLDNWHRLPGGFPSDLYCDAGQLVLRRDFSSVHAREGQMLQGLISYLRHFTPLQIGFGHLTAFIVAVTLSLWKHCHLLFMTIMIVLLEAFDDLQFRQNFGLAAKLPLIVTIWPLIDFLNDSRLQVLYHPHLCTPRRRGPTIKPPCITSTKRITEMPTHLARTCSSHHATGQRIASRCQEDGVGSARHRDA